MCYVLLFGICLSVSMWRYFTNKWDRDVHMMSKKTTVRKVCSATIKAPLQGSSPVASHSLFSQSIMVSCLLHALPPVTPTHPLINTESMDEKQDIKSTSNTTSAFDGIIQTLMAIMSINYNNKNNLVSRAVVLLNERKTSLIPGTLISNQSTLISAAATFFKARNPLPPPALQQPPLWSYTHSHVRDVRINSDELRMLAVEKTMMRRAKIVRPLRNRQFLTRRQDDFVWGVKSSLRYSL